MSATPTPTLSTPAPSEAAIRLAEVIRTTCCYNAWNGMDHYPSVARPDTERAIDAEFAPYRSAVEAALVAWEKRDQLNAGLFEAMQSLAAIHAQGKGV